MTSNSQWMEKVDESKRNKNDSSNSLLHRLTVHAPLSSSHELLVKETGQCAMSTKMCVTVNLEIDA